MSTDSEVGRVQFVVDPEPEPELDEWGSEIEIQRKETRKSYQRNTGNLLKLSQYPPLTANQVHERQQKYGRNELDSQRKTPWYVIMGRCLLHPFNILMCSIAVLCGVLKIFDSMGIMLFLSVFGAAIRFYSEMRSNRAAANLLSLVTNNCTVLRVPKSRHLQPIMHPEPVRDTEMSVDTKELVPGDIVVLNPGDSIPADLEILYSNNLVVTQSSLTGESLPVEKYSTPQHNNNAPKKLSASSTSNDTILGNEDESNNVDNTQVKEVGTSPEVERPNCCCCWCEDCTSCEGCGNCVCCSCSHSDSWYSVTSLSRSFRSCIGLRTGLESEQDQERVNLDQPHMCYMGTSVVSGTALTIVRATGTSTYLGKMAKVLKKRRPVNAFQLGVRLISWIFFGCMICMVPPVVLFQGIFVQKGKNWFAAVKMGLSVAVGMTPEMLPMIVNTCLAVGAVQMSKKQCIVKNNDAIVNMGAMDVLCTDKTGTLTKSVVVLSKHINGAGYTSVLPLILGFLNLKFQSVRGTPIDIAILAFCKKYVTALHSGFTDGDFSDNGDLPGAKMPHIEILDKWRDWTDIPYDFVRKRATVLIGREAGYAGDFLVICKGAVEETLVICTRMLVDSNKPDPNYGIEDFEDVKIPDESTIIPMTEEDRSRLKKKAEKLNEEGLRVIVVAYKLQAKDSINIEEADFIFTGFLAFLDPPKPSTKRAIEQLRKYNVDIKVLTGDSSAVCKKICQEIGLPIAKIYTSKDFYGATDSEVSHMAERGTIFAQLTPLQKCDIVKALKRNGKTVGFLGDGINDAPALSEADVGISVDTGTGIAKDASDIILLEKNIGVIVDGVVIGRKTYGNTMKYMSMAISSNFGNVFSILTASWWLPFEPMGSTQLIVQNLLYDVSQMAIPWDNMDEEFLAVPHKWSIVKLLTFMFALGPWSSIFDVMTFSYLYFYNGIQTNGDRVCLFQTVWFTVGIITQTSIVHVIRTPKVPFIRSRPSIYMVLSTLAVIGFSLCLPYLPRLNRWLHLVAIPAKMYIFISIMVAAYWVVVQIVKMVFLVICEHWY